MCDECWKQFRGWCKSFTVTEAVLAALEAVLLLGCVAFLVFLVGHFIACEQLAVDELPMPPPPPPPPNGTAPPDDTGDTDGSPITTESPSAGVTCTMKSTAEDTTRYFTRTRTRSTAGHWWRPLPSDRSDGADHPMPADKSDGEEPEAAYCAAVLALGKRRGRGGEPVLGCPLTAVSEHWALTAASCLDAVEETDALDAYMMVERWGSARARTHAVADVRVHPRYGDRPRRHDAAALRSADPLLHGAAPPRLPSLADYFLITVGERFTVLGFGPFRSLGSGSYGLREVHVYSLNPKQCATQQQEQEDSWSSRHLEGGAALPHGACAPAHDGLCAGVLYARGAPCGYCAGSPLMRGRTLLGLAAAGSAPCGEACEPLSYVNLALLRPWIDDLLRLD